MTRVYNRISEKETRRALRNEMPRAEVLLWSKLQARQLYGLKFRRQFSFGPCIVDFYCPTAKLAVEVDGETHGGATEDRRDAVRQAYIESFGVRFVRCTNEDVYRSLDGVLEEIARVALERLAVEERPP